MSLDTGEITLTMECPDDTDDVHLCGRCRSTFGDLNEFINHKKECRKKPINSLAILKAEDQKDLVTNVDLSMTIDGKDCTNNDLNLATDEAAVISLLANQLSSQNTKNANDDLEQLTLVFKEELEAIESQNNKPNNVLRPPAKKSSPKKKVATTTIQTTTINVKDEESNTKIGINVVESEKKIKNCTVLNCNFTAYHTKDLIRHMRIHTGEKPFECQYCQKAFSRQDKCKNHERIHTGEKPYKCSLCPYGTADGGSLRKHMRVHLDERPFKCQLCSYRSRDNSQLTVHLRTHTNDRPFVCSYEQCSSAFKTNSDLKRHSKLHSCIYCSFKNGNISQVKLHGVKNHAEELSKTSPSSVTSLASKIKEESNVYECSICDFKAESKIAVTHHERKKHSQCLKVCQISDCSFKYRTEAQIDIHMKKSHEISKKKINNKKQNNRKQTNSTLLINSNNAKAKVVSRKKETFIPNYMCSICSATFIREDSYKSHMRQHQQRDEISNEITNIDILDKYKHMKAEVTTSDHSEVVTVDDKALNRISTVTEGGYQYIIVPSDQLQLPLK